MDILDDSSKIIFKQVFMNGFFYHATSTLQLDQILLGNKKSSMCKLGVLDTVPDRVRKKKTILPCTRVDSCRFFWRQNMLFKAMSSPSERAAWICGFVCSNWWCHIDPKKSSLPLSKIYLEPSRLTSFFEGQGSLPKTRPNFRSKKGHLGSMPK